MSAPRVESIARALALRVRTQRALQGAITGGALGALAALALLTLWRLGWTSDESAAWALGAFVGGALIGALLCAWRVPGPIALAQRVDRAHGLHDLLSSALAFARLEDPSAFERAQIAEAERRANSIDTGAGAPWRRPRDLGALAVALVACALIVGARAPAAPAPIPPLPAPSYAPVLDEATLALERDRADALKELAARTNSEEIKKAAEELEELLDAVANQEISEREFLERLAQIEQRLAPKQSDEEEAAMRDELAAAAEELLADREVQKLLKKDGELKALMESLAAGEESEASKAMSKLAEKLLDEQNGMSKEQLERMAKLMEKFAGTIDPESAALEKLMQKHKDLIESLSRKMEKRGALSSKDAQKLKDAKKKLDDAEREKAKGFNEDAKASSAKKRQLQRLMRDAAEKMKQQAGAQGNKQKPQPGEKKPDFRNEIGRAINQASKEMEEQSREEKEQDARGEARRQIQQAREAMERAERGDSEAQKKRGERVKDFMKRAGKRDDEQKEPGEGKQAGKPGERKEGKPASEGRGREGQQPDGKKVLAGAKPTGMPGSGDQAGDQAGDKKEGSLSRPGVRGQEERVRATPEGEGASRAEVIEAASESGFASRQYKKVYDDYTAAAEDVMDKEKVPKGYRHYIKRYFQLIQPRGE